MNQADEEKAQEAAEAKLPFEGVAAEAVYSSDYREMSVADLVALLEQLDPATRARVLREAIPESDWARISDEDDAAAKRFLEMTDEEFNAAIVEAGGDPERHDRAAQAMGRWARKLAETHVELAAARAEVERLRVDLADAPKKIDRAWHAGFDAATGVEPEPKEPK